MVDVIVAEPNPLLRMSLQTVLGQHADIRVVAEVEDETVLIPEARATPHDVMLAGLGMLRHVGADAVRALRRGREAGGLLVHSYEWDRGFAQEAARFGATGYFSHECSPADLHAAVLHVAAGRPFITRSLGMEIAAAACFRAVPLDGAALSAREKNVFRMLAIGLSTRQIAVQLGVGECDVVACKWRIMARMDVPNAGPLVRHAITQACREWPRPEPDGAWRVA
jgi:DNA-binding NarL/FixJ family response regulator